MEANIIEQAVDLLLEAAPFAGRRPGDPEADFEEWRDTPGTVLYEVATVGRVVEYLSAANVPSRDSHEVYGRIFNFDAKPP